MKRILLISLLLAGSASVMAKLPAPVLDDAAKAKAEEAKAKTAHAGKVDAYKLCLSMDRAAASYFKTAATSGKADCGDSSTGTPLAIASSTGRPKPS